jgi:hypothetical protein
MAPNTGMEYTERNVLILGFSLEWSSIGERAVSFER